MHDQLPAAGAPDRTSADRISVGSDKEQATAPERECLACRNGQGLAAGGSVELKGISRFTGGHRTVACQAVIATVKGARAWQARDVACEGGDGCVARSG